MRRIERLRKGLIKRENTCEGSETIWGRRIELQKWGKTNGIPLTPISADPACDKEGGVEVL
jgi:hypothetical protein